MHIKSRNKDVIVTFSGPNCVQGRCCLSLVRAGRQGAGDASDSLISERESGRDAETKPRYWLGLAHEADSARKDARSPSGGSLTDVNVLIP